MNQMQDSLGEPLATGHIVAARKQLEATFPAGGACRIAKGTPGIVEDFIPDEQRVLVGFEAENGATISVHADPGKLYITN